MVLQQNAPVRVWGTASPGEKVTVSFQRHSVAVTAASSGSWEVTLPELQPGNPGEMAITGSNSIFIRDVAVGEVWVASGQSNMAMSVSRANNAEKEAAAGANPDLRCFQISANVAGAPLADHKGEWIPATPQSVPKFYATAYFFARELHRRYKIPVGVIQAAVGGTPAESWISQSALDADPSLAPLLDKWRGMLIELPSATERYQQQLKAWESKSGTQNAARPQPPPAPGHRWQPAGLFNGMIAPVIPYTIRGAIWYQGEHNAGRDEGGVYRHLLETLIRDWRARWNQGDFPFLWVQLPNYVRPNSTHDGWSEVQDAMRCALETRNTGMAVIIDIGDPKDIHPTNKQDVGARLARVARAVAYGEQITFSGPLVRGVTAGPETLRVWFDQAGPALKTTDGGPVKSFEVAGAGGDWKPVPARVDGQTVLLTLDPGLEAASLRYAWGGNPEVNLVNSENLPASPFRISLDHHRR
jgi:sialate O-acetylesterase